MAMELTFTGWLNDAKKFDWATVLKCAHHVRRKNEAGEWETVGKDYIDVIVEDMSMFPQITEDVIPCRIKVTGNMKPGSYERTNTDGQTEHVLFTKVWAKEIEVMDQDFVPAATVEDVPF
jgi:hypothetical protein